VVLAVDVCELINFSIVVLLLSGQEIIDAAALYAQDVVFGRFVALSDHPGGIFDKTAIGQLSNTRHLARVRLKQSRTEALSLAHGG
jgi:hypothetical protein